MSSSFWPVDPGGDMTHILESSIEAAKARHPSGKATNVQQPPTAPANIVLTAHDRCDRCGASAVYRVGLLSVQAHALDFCLHHWRKSFPAMQPEGWAVIGANPSLAAAMGGTVDGTHAT